MQNYSHPFVNHVKQECKRYGCKFKLIYKGDVRTSEDKDKLAGFFRDDPLELVVATRVMYTDFLSTLVHEFSHFEQWIDDPKSFAPLKKYDYRDIFYHWLYGREYSKRTIAKSIDYIRDLEVDCERRAVRNIARFKLPINIPRYCRNASAYIHFHNFVKRKRVWHTKNSPWDFKGILKLMPDNMDGDYTKTPRNIMRLYDKHLLATK